MSSCLLHSALISTATGKSSPCLSEAMTYATSAPTLWAFFTLCYSFSHEAQHIWRLGFKLETYLPRSITPSGMWWTVSAELWTYSTVRYVFRCISADVTRHAAGECGCCVHPGAPCHRQSRRGVTHCTAAGTAQGQLPGLPYLACKVSKVMCLMTCSTNCLTKRTAQVFICLFFRSLFVRILCPCIIKPTDGSSELRKVNDFNRGYQVQSKDIRQ